MNINNGYPVTRAISLQQLLRQLSYPARGRKEAAVLSQAKRALEVYRDFQVTLNRGRAAEAIQLMDNRWQHDLNADRRTYFHPTLVTWPPDIPLATARSPRELAAKRPFKSRAERVVEEEEGETFVGDRAIFKLVVATGVIYALGRIILSALF